MKSSFYITVAIIGLVSLSSCVKNKSARVEKNSSQATAHSINKETLTQAYANEDFSIQFPSNFVCDDSGWKGKDSIENEVYIYPITNSAEDETPILNIRCVKAYLHIGFKSAKEAADMVKAIRLAEKDPKYLGVVYEMDSIDVDNFPAYIILHAWNLDGDTLLQKQFITLLPKSHTLFYFNSNIRSKYWEEGQELSDRIISSITFSSSLKNE